MAHFSERILAKNVNSPLKCKASPREQISPVRVLGESSETLEMQVKEDVQGPSPVGSRLLDPTANYSQTGTCHLPLLVLNCGAGVHSREFLGLQGDQTSQS